MSPDEGLADVDYDAELTDEPERPPTRRARTRTGKRHVTNPSPARHRSEADIQRGVVLRLNIIGYAVVTTGSEYTTTGTPDVLGCVGGRMVAVEVKRPGNTPTAVQLGQLRRWQKAGALAGWVTSEEDLDELLDRLQDPAWSNDFAQPGGPSRVDPVDG